MGRRNEKEAWGSCGERKINGNEEREAWKQFLEMVQRGPGKALVLSLALVPGNFLLCHLKVFLLK